MDLHANVAGASGQGVATGTVIFGDSTAGVFLGDAALNVKAEAEFLMSLNTGPQLPAPLTIGPHTLTASYSGDASFNASALVSLPVTITKGNPTVSIDSGNSFTSEQSSTLQAAVVPTGSILPTGTVQFLDGGIALGTAQLQTGSVFVSLPVTFGNEGNHSITASYSGDSTYNAAVSPVQVVNVVPPFSFQGTTTATVVAGQTATYNLTFGTFSSPSTFSGVVALTCSGAPVGTTCSVSPTSITLTPTVNGGPVTVTVVTSASAALREFPFRGLPIVFGMIFATAISLNRNRKHRWQIGCIAVLILGMSSCGGGGTGTPPISTPPPSTQATIVVSATSGTHVSTVNLSLTITH
jgi:hypothetical protein